MSEVFKHFTKESECNPILASATDFIWFHSNYQIRWLHKWENSHFTMVMTDHDLHLSCVILWQGLLGSLVRAFCENLGIRFPVYYLISFYLHCLGGIFAQNVQFFKQWMYTCLFKLNRRMLGCNESIPNIVTNHRYTRQIPDLVYRPV